LQGLPKKALILSRKWFDGVAASALPFFGVTIPRCLITSRDTELGDKVGCFIIEVSSINSVDASSIEASMSSMLLLVG